MFFQSGDRSNFISASQSVDALLGGFETGLGGAVNTAREYAMGSIHEATIQGFLELQRDYRQVLAAAHQLADERDRLIVSNKKLRDLRAVNAQAMQRIESLEREIAGLKSEN
nr:hypothetical protein [uncultured Albidiferax sp.]